MKSSRFNFVTLFSGALILTLFSHAVAGVEVERVNRYTLHTLAADSSQVDLLSAVIDTRFPPYVETVGSAIDYILHRSGYRHVATKDIEQALALQLPETHRSIGPLNIRSAIQTIAGQSWQLHEDVEKRVLWFQKAGADSLDINQLLTTSPASDDHSDADTSDEATETTKLKVWHLRKFLTLRENIDNWVQLTDWSLEWRSRHDYAITQDSNYSGTLAQAVSALLKHYQNAPVPLVAKFFNGNSVLVIEPAQTE